MLCTPKQLTYMMSLTFTIGYLGAISGRPVTMFVERFGWENVLLVISFIGMLIAAGLLLLNAPYQNENTHQKTSNAGLMTILKKPQVILVCICGALQIGPLEAFADIWGINYFVKVHSINKVEASTLTSAIYVGLCLGGPLIAYLAEKSQRYYETCALCGLAMMGLFILLLSGIKLNFTMILLMMLLIGIFSGYQIIVFSITSQAVSISLNGVATSVTNMIIMSAGFVFHFIIGRLMDYYSDGTISNGIHVYGAEAYTKSIIIIPVTLFIGFTGFFLLKPKVKSF
jgi:MFS family permease